MRMDIHRASRWSPVKEKKRGEDMTYPRPGTSN